VQHAPRRVEAAVDRAAPGLRHTSAHPGVGRRLGVERIADSSAVSSGPRAPGPKGSYPGGPRGALVTPLERELQRVEVRVEVAPRRRGERRRHDNSPRLSMCSSQFAARGVIRLTPRRSACSIAVSSPTPQIQLQHRQKSVRCLGPPGSYSPKRGLTRHPPAASNGPGRPRARSGSRALEARPWPAA
jgi:hypothetical protein